MALSRLDPSEPGGIPVKPAPSKTAFSVTTALDGYREAHTVFAETAGKARYASLLNAWDAGFDGLSFRHVKVRSLGKMEAPDERADRLIADFNSRYPVGTPVRVYPGRMGDHETAYDTAVKEPGAFKLGGGVSVKVPGDSIAITHVVPLVPLP